MSKVMITGAAGFIGSQLAYRLYKQGDELILIDNFSYGKEDNLIFDDHSFTDEVIRMDIRDREGIAELLKNGDVDYIYNIAGIAPLPDCQSNPQEAIDVNVIGTVNLLENARKYGVKKFILASTNAITADGCLVNIDGTGNRVGAMIAGPGQVIIIAGVNKLVIR